MAEDNAIERARWGDTHTCDSCGCEVSGCTAQDLIIEGWRWHPIPYRSHEYFVLCADCEVKRTQRQRTEGERMATDLAPQRQRLVVYGSYDNPTIYTSVYNNDDAKSAVGECCARHGRTCGARVEDGVTVALKHQARDPKFGEVVGK